MPPAGPNLDLGKDIAVENVLGEIGKGHIIAFNILNIGRLKLGAATIGASKYAATVAIQYAKTREQFKTAIANFGAIKHKIAEMGIRIWVAESGLYRTTKWIADKEHLTLSLPNNLRRESKAHLFSTDA